MSKLFRKPYAYALLFSVLLIAANALLLLNIFVIPHYVGTVKDSTVQEVQEVRQSQADTGEETQESKAATVTADSYADDNVQITIDTVRQNNTTVYVADVKLSSAAYLKTALAENTFGTNVTEKTSEIAGENNAILAVNGDYYGADSSGYVIKNGQVYRDSVRKDSNNGDMVLYEDGSTTVVYEEEVSAKELADSGVAQLFAFGPVLVDDGEITVSENNEVGKAMASNPRTALGWIDELHYILVVSDGRTEESEGLSLYELAAVMQEYGCQFAYNLDGGGSSTMYFNGEVINNPTTSGRNISERAVSDIVYIGS